MKNDRNHTTNGMRRMLLVALAGLLTMLGTVGCQPDSPENGDSPVATGKSSSGTPDASASVPEESQIQVKVAVRFNQRSVDLDLELECPAGTTVFQATQMALEDNGVSFESSGSGELAFVKSIGGVANELAAGDNWVYRVNGKVGSVGSGVREIEDSDQITWSFGEYEPGDE